jgi:hypothetical protein
MKKISLFIGVLLVMASCTKNDNNKCYTCVITKSIRIGTIATSSKDTVAYCGDEQGINSFIRENRKAYFSKDSSNLSDIYCK